MSILVWNSGSPSLYGRRRRISACIRVHRFSGIAIAMSALLASGCTGLSARLDSPLPEQIIKYTAAFEVHAKAKISTGEDYVLAGYSYVDEHCEQFFVELEVEKRKLLFAKNSLQQTFATAPSIVTITSGAAAAAKPVAILASLAGLSTLLFDQYGQQFTFSPYGAQLRAKVQDAHYKYKELLHETVSTWNTPLATSRISEMLKAHQIVQGYARICTIPQMEQFIVTALDRTRAGNAEQPVVLRCIAQCDDVFGNNEKFQKCMNECRVDITKSAPPATNTKRTLRALGGSPPPQSRPYSVPPFSSVTN